MQKTKQVLCYFSGLVAMMLVLITTLQAQSFTQKGLKAQYFNKAGFLDSAFSRRGETINIEGKKDAASTLSSNQFSVIWKGYIIPSDSEKYTFSVQTSGSYRLWVNDSLLIDQPDNQTNQTFSGAIHLTKGVQYDFKSEFSNTAKTPVCQLYWQTKKLSKEIVPQKSLVPEGGEMPPVKVLTNVIARDPFVTLAPDGFYYMVSTSCYFNGTLSHTNAWDHNDGLHLYKSADMNDWKDEGLIWSIEANGTWQKKYDDKHRRPLWAPEIHYINSKKNWYIVYSMGTFAPIGILTGLLKSSTGKPEGPYENVVDTPIVKGIDGSLFEDGDGAVYFLHDNCLIARMNTEMNGFTEPFRQLKTESGKLVGFEGSGIYKTGNKYYLFAAAGDEDMGKNTYDLTIGVAENIYGPYSERWMALRHGGHGTLFTDKQGTLWTTMFGTDDLSNVYITPSVVKMTIDENGKILPLRNEARAKVILPTAEIESIQWKYTTAQPGSNWNQKSFADAAWLKGESGFSKEGNTKWTTKDIWLRTTFNAQNLTAEEMENLVLSASHSGAIEIYINGVEACAIKGANKYSLEKISAKAKQAIVNNKSNLLAVHCKNEGAPFVTDAGLVTWSSE